MKSIFSSKTFWIAFLQLIAGGFVIFGTSYPDLAGILLILKSFVDIILRTLTTEPVKI